MKPSILRFFDYLAVRYVAFSLLFSMLPLLILHYYAVRSSSEFLLATLSENLKEKSFLVAKDIDRLIEQRLTETRILSQADVLERGDLAAITKYLDEIIAEADHLNDIDIIDLSGQIIACSSDQGEIGFNVNELYPGVQPLFQQAVSAGQGDVFVTDVLWLDGEPGIVFLTPVTDENNSKVVRVMMVEFGLDVVAGIVAAFDERVIGDEHVYIIDKQGRVIVSHDQMVSHFGKFPDLQVRPDLLKMFAVQNIADVVYYLDRDSHEVVAGYVDMMEFGLNKSLDWTIVAKAPVHEIIAPVLALRDRLLVFTIAASTLIALLIFYGSRGLVKPIAKIAFIANEIAKGNLSVDIKTERRDELGQLSLSISHMLEALRDGAKKNRELTVQLENKIIDLRESEIRHHTIIQTLGDALITMDEDGVIDDINPSGVEIFGYSVDELSGRKFSVLLSKSMEQSFEYQSAGASQAQPVILDKTIEIKGRRKDGSLFPLEVNFAMMQLDGRHGFVGLMRDISERKEAENALLDASQLNHKIIQESPIGLAIYDHSGQCIAANNSLAEMVGATRQQVLDQNYNEIESWKKYGMLEIVKRAITEQHNMRHKFKVTTTFGKRAFFDCLFVPLTISNDHRLLLMMDDISQREVAVQALRKSQSALSEAQKMAKHGSWEWDVATGKIDLSDEIFRILGMEPQEMEMNIDTFMSFIHSQDLPIIQDAIVRIRDKHVDQVYEYRVCRKDSEVRYIKSIGKLVVSEDNSLGKMVGVMQDVTESRYAEEQLKNSLIEKEVLLKEIHHRVKNNMQIISSLMYLQAQKTTSRETLEVLQESQGRIKSMALIHEQLYQRGDLARILFKEYIETLVKYLREVSLAKASRVTFRVEAEGIELPVDIAIPCGLVINELVTNCLKHAFAIDQSGVITVRFSRKADSYTLTVEDDGVGFPSDYDWSLSDTLGMKIIHTLAGQLDGELAFENDNGLRCLLTFKWSKSD